MAGDAGLFWWTILYKLLVSLLFPFTEIYAKGATLHWFSWVNWKDCGAGKKSIQAMLNPARLNASLSSKKKKRKLVRGSCEGLTAGLSASWHKLSSWEDFPLFFYMPEESGSISFGGLFSLPWLVHAFSWHVSSVFSLALAFQCVCFVSIDLDTTTLH